MFKPVSAQADFRKIEDAVLKIWKERRIFTKIKAARDGAVFFICEDIPISASSKPTLTDTIAWTYKDIILRYQTMRGKNVLRRAAWLAHGIQVEIEAEKHLGIKNRDEIETAGLERFIDTCQRAAFHYTYEWEKITEKMGYWIDWDNAFATHTNTYIESVWSILKGFWDKGLINKKDAVVPFCPRCGTPLSYLEIDYGTESEPTSAFFIRLPVVDEPSTSLLIWTANPWTLPACTAVAVQPDADYVIVERHMEEGGSERLILAKTHLEAVFSTASLSPQISFLPAESVKTISEFKGKKIKGLRYHPLFTTILPEKPAHYVVLAEEIPIEEGSGIHPLIPAFNQTDLLIAQQNNLAMNIPVQPDGTFSAEIRPWSGKTPQQVNPLIAEDLTRRGLVLRSDPIEQLSPLCTYCNSPVMDYIRSVWTLNTARLRETTASSNDDVVQWLPAELHSAVNRLEDAASEWVLGHERFYGTPLPIWCDDNGEAVMIGSISELAELARCDPAIIDPHRPAIDGITFVNKKTGKLMHRVPHLVDTWFDLGAMPAAQYHYPFEGKAAFASRYPIQLTYTHLNKPPRWLHALLTVCAPSFNQTVFHSAIGLPKILDTENQTLVDEDIILKEYLDTYSADALRWFWLNIPPGDAYSFTSQKPAELWSSVFQGLWKTYAFFVTFANLRGWQPDHHQTEEDRPSPNPLHCALDRWLLSFLHETLRSVTKAYELYDFFSVAKLLQEFNHCLCEWYLSRSQHRFWMSANDTDEKAAFQVLYKSLNIICRLFAPIAPFTMEEMYQNLNAQNQAKTHESIHLTSWPDWDISLIDEELNRAMRLVIHLAELGYSAIVEGHGQPGQVFKEAIFTLRQPYETDIVRKYEGLLKDALHVKHVRTQISPHDGFELVESQYSLFVSPAGRYQVMLTAEAARPAALSDASDIFIQQILQLRRQAGFDTTIPINVYLAASKTLTESLLAQRRQIMRATLAVEIITGEPPVHILSSGLVLANEMITLGIEMVKQKSSS